MIEKTKIVQLVEEKLGDKMFLVDVAVSKTNKIAVTVDSFNGLTIDDCVEISRHVEHNLDREVEDFELEVSSPGLMEDFKVRQQFIKNIGREIEVMLVGDIRVRGKLKGIKDEEITLETSLKEKVEGHRKKQFTVKENILKYEEIISAKVVISF